MPDGFVECGGGGDSAELAEDTEWSRSSVSTLAASTCLLLSLLSRMLKHGIQTTSTFHLVVDRLSQDTRNTLADANADAARFVGDVYEDESRAIWRNGPVLGARGLQQQKTNKNDEQQITET